MAISRDGLVVVGTSATATTGAFRWVNGAMTQLPCAPADWANTATAANADGSVIGGSCAGDSNFDLVRWDNGSRGGLGTLPGGGGGYYVMAMNPDASVIVGSAQNASGFQEAYSWVGGTMTGLGFLPDRPESRAQATSDDGSVIVGLSILSGNAPKAVRWVNGIIEDIGYFPGGGSFPDSRSEAVAVSADGSVVIGMSTTATDTYEPFRLQSGLMTSLGAGNPLAANADASVVVGTCGPFNKACRWTAATGWQDVRTELMANGVDMTGWSLDNVTGISADGTVIVGWDHSPNSSGHEEGWIVRLPLPIALQVSPATDIAASGFQGGPFSPASFDYSLSALSGSVDYSITGVPSWLDVSSTSGTVTTSPSTITFTVKASANSLGGGTYGPATITFSNTTNGLGNQTRTATLTVTVPLSLQVSPANNMVSSGNQGGSFTPASFDYSLSASSGSIDYSISGLPAWLDASSSSGTLTTSPTTVTFSPNANANGLSPGSYNATISFTNTTNGQGNQTRTAALTVNAGGGGGGNATAKIYVSKSGADSGLCPVTEPCATLNYALSIADAGAAITILDAGMFGPIVLSKTITIDGGKANNVQIVADPTAQVGCVGALPSGCGLTNNGFAVEVTASSTDTVKIANVLLGAGSNGAGALKLTSGGQIQLSNDVFRGNGTATGPIIALYPNNPGTTQAQVYFSNSDVGFNNPGNGGAGAVEVKPSGNTSLKLHFNHVEVHNASYGIRSDSSLLSNSSVVVATAISESEFFSFPNAAVNAFSTTGTGLTNAVFNDVNILNAAVAIKANGPQSIVVLTNSTVVGNTAGVQTVNGGTVFTSQNNTIKGNGVDGTGALTAAARR